MEVEKCNFGKARIPCQCYFLVFNSPKMVQDQECPGRHDIHGHHRHDDDDDDDDGGGGHQSQRWGDSAAWRLCGGFVERGNTPALVTADDREDSDDGDDDDDEEEEEEVDDDCEADADDDDLEAEHGNWPALVTADDGGKVKMIMMIIVQMMMIIPLWNILEYPGFPFALG